jgi:hypothetical protein
MVNLVNNGKCKAKINIVIPTWADKLSYKMHKQINGFYIVSGAKHKSIEPQMSTQLPNLHMLIIYLANKAPQHPQKSST